MKRFIAGIVFAIGLLLPGVAAAQCNDAMLPPNTLMGRLGTGPGPCEAIPFAALLAQPAFTSHTYFQAISVGPATVPPDSLITIMANTAAAQTPPLSDTLFHVVGQQGHTIRQVFDAYGTNAGSTIEGRLANGTNTDKTPVVANDQMMSIGAHGWDGSIYSSDASITFDAEQNFATNNHSTRIRFLTTSPDLTLPFGGMTLGHNSNGQVALGIGIDYLAPFGENNSMHLAFREYPAAARSIGINRSTSADSGTALSLSAGSGKVGATNANGGNLALVPGTSTGSGTSVATIYAFPGTAAATTDNTVAAVATFAANTTSNVKLTIGTTGTSLGNLVLAGSTSGFAIIAPQATAGGATLTAGTASGTIAASATSPLAINATTGVISCSTCGVTSSPLSQFAATTSAQLAGNVSDETGTGALVFGTGPTITLTNATGLPISTGLTGAGSGVLTALGVNVGTAGAVLVNGGALGSPSSAGTIPAFTLSGTIAGGGNQLNNIIIGTSTPLAGSFTTLSASTSVTSPVYIGGSGTTSTAIIRSTSGSGTTGADIIFQTGSNGATEDARILNSGFFGIGTNAPQSKLHVNTNTTQNVAPAQPGSTVLEVSGADTVPTEIDIESYGSIVGSFLTFSATNGTAASPSQTPSGTIVGLFGGRGYTNSSAYTQKNAQLRFTAAENLTTSAAGMSVSVLTTPVGTTATATAATFQASGGFSVGTTTDPGIGSVIANKVVQTVATTVASLPTCNTAAKGARSFVTDANATFTAGIGAAVAAGGANNVPVTCDGTNWRIG